MYISCLNAASIYANTGYTNFLTSQELAMPIAYLIATRALAVYRHTFNSLELQED